MNPIIMRFRHIAVSLSCLCLAQLLNAQLTHTVTFDRNLLSIDTTVVDRVSYLKIKYLDLWGEGNIGSPRIAGSTPALFGPLQCCRFYGNHHRTEYRYRTLHITCLSRSASTTD